MKANKTGLFLGPLGFAILLLLPIPDITPPAKKVLASAWLMAVWWITEALPIPATSLLPFFLFPVLGIMNAKKVAVPYSNSNIFLFLGGFFIARAMEKHNLHRRIALRIALIIGTSRRKLILGFMAATAFLSMWISNTATTMMMFPIALAVISQLNVEGDRFKTAMMLSIAYAASLGGIATLVGTPPNIVFAGQMKTLFPDAPEITFTRWILVGLPLTLVFLPLAWLYLTRVAFKVSKAPIARGKDYLRELLAEMGPMRRGERITFTVFLLVAFLWIFRKNLTIGGFTLPGWSNLLGISKYVNDSTVAIFGALLLFVIPTDWSKYEFALDWDTALRIPWGIILLFGGGFALASAFKVSGLSEWIGYKLAVLKGAPHPVLVIATATLLTFLTELTSNTATATLMMPILAAVARGLGVHPLLLMIPATFSVSCAFMLPVATPPNAIIYGSGYVKISDMARTGLIMNFTGIILITLLTYALAIPVFHITPTQLPPWMP
ncbi:MAG: SLC13/DASS family transporter [Candidatus Hydrothermota bacterium]|nr:MAG: SLC13/DASS family transporter [Candidatus Hydrothermae bacterium]